MIAIMLNALTMHLPDGRMRYRRLAQGATLFHRGDAVRSVCFVVSGTVELVRHGPDGKPAILQRANDGDMLAEASVFSETYHCDAVATRPAEITELPRAAFLDLLGKDGPFARTWMEHLARQTQAARLRAEILTLKTVSQRLDAWLAFNGEKLPSRGEQIAVAKQIGVSPEAFYREIARRKAMPL